MTVTQHLSGAGYKYPDIFTYLTLYSFFCGAHCI